MGGTQSTEGLATPEQAPAPPSQFVPLKDLQLKDQILVDMVNGNDHKGLCVVITDPAMPDNPIIFASDGFCRFTGYSKQEIEGRNCRFLQGEKTDAKDIARIREALRDLTPTSVNLLNYRKDGTEFRNQFFICPLFDDNQQVAYFFGVQVEVDSAKPGQQSENPGWVYQMGLHE